MKQLIAEAALVFKNTRDVAYIISIEIKKSKIISFKKLTINLQRVLSL